MLGPCCVEGMVSPAKSIMGVLEANFSCSITSREPELLSMWVLYTHPDHPMLMVKQLQWFTTA